MKNFFCLILLIFCTSCFNNSDTTKEITHANFCGYGVIVFSKSLSGSIRYMEFYPVSEAKYPDKVFIKKIKISLNSGIIIRGNNSTKLWQELIETNNSNPDEYGYYKSLIFLNLSNNKLKYNFKKSIPNEVLIQNEIFKTKVFDYVDGKLVISNYKIFNSL
jgi:hypothetical protein